MSGNRSASNSIVLTCRPSESWFTAIASLLRYVSRTLAEMLRTFAEMMSGLAMTHHIEN